MLIHNVHESVTIQTAMVWRLLSMDVLNGSPLTRQLEGLMMDSTSTVTITRSLFVCVAAQGPAKKCVSSELLIIQLITNGR